MHIIAVTQVLPGDESLWDLGFPEIHGLVPVVLQRPQRVEILKALSPLGAVELTSDKDVFQKTVC